MNTTDAAMNYLPIIECVAEPVIIYSPNGIIQFTNIAANRSFGYTTASLSGQAIGLVLPGLMPDSSEESARITYGQRKDGSTFPAEVVVSAIETLEGLLCIATIRDNSKQAAAEKAAIESAAFAEKAKTDLEQFAYIVSHDLQAEVRSVNNFAGLLAKYQNAPVDDDFSLFLNIITGASDKISVLLGEILSFSRIGRTGKIEAIDLNLVLKDVLAEVKPLAGVLDAKITVDTLPVINCNALEMKVVFLHLLTNALIFSKKEAPSEIFLTYKNKSTAHEFFISDNGIGIAEKYFQKIFRMFQRLNSADDYPGNGAGLAFCKKIIEAHNGEIGVSSKLGEGSVFNFTIPVNQSI